jgi:hypothetical protein
LSNSRKFNRQLKLSKIEPYEKWNIYINAETPLKMSVLLIASGQMQNRSAPLVLVSIEAEGLTTIEED